ncbi:MAG: histidine phosphatase family protein [Burkholderiales bacterium]|nr:histidine phosphatase family protein [Burkholderiales bacterium]
MVVRASLTLALLLAFSSAGAFDADAALWAALESGGHVALMRHALAPGTGDPNNFRIDDCATQRNLSEAGRQQARAIGARFRERGIKNVVLFSSLWCRCLETARLLDIGEVRPFPGLNSFFRDNNQEAARSAAVRKLINEHAKGPSLMLVTHQGNITALTGVFPQSGEIVVLRLDGDKLIVLGSISER